jgi:hypothetical protein
MSFKVEHRLGIQAPAEKIWEAFAELESWPSWNPMYPRAKGVIRIGEALSLTEKVEGLGERESTPRIVDWVPHAQLIWAEKLGFMSSAVRFFEIEQLDDAGTGCIFANGAIFNGFFGEGYGHKRRRQLKAAFTAVGEALKARVEGA